MFIGSDDKLSKIRDMPFVYIDNLPIKSVSSSKSLGVYIDHTNLTTNTKKKGLFTNFRY